MNYDKLRGRIREVFRTQQAFSKAIGMSQVSVSHRLNGKLEWKSSEIANACKALDIPLSESAVYFFTNEVKKS